MQILLQCHQNLVLEQVDHTVYEVTTCWERDTQNETIFPVMYGTFDIKFPSAVWHSEGMSIRNFLAIVSEWSFDIWNIIFESTVLLPYLLETYLQIMDLQAELFWKALKNFAVDNVWILQPFWISFSRSCYCYGIFLFRVTKLLIYFAINISLLTK